MENARLEHKLIVPAHQVPLNALDHFKITLKNEEGEFVDYAYYYLDYQQNLYYFDRGDLGLIYRVFPHLKIEDRRSSPMMNCSSTVTNQGLGLTFTGQLRANQQPVADFLINGLGNGQLKAHPRFGKTVVMTYVTCKLGLKTLFLSHEISLAKQALEKFEIYTNCLELEKTLGRKVVGIVEKWEDMLELDVCIMPYQKFVSGKNSKEWLLRLRNQFGLVFVDECFHYNTMVTLADETQIMIGKLVSMLLKGHIFFVKSYNHEKQLWEPKRVSGYSKSKATEDWCRIGLGGSSGILCSSNHGWYLEGYKKIRADELKVGDTVMTFPDISGRIVYPNVLGEWQKQLIFGGLLGDLCLKETTNRARIGIVHGKKQTEYYNYKTYILSNLIRANDKNYISGYSKVGTLSNTSLSSIDIRNILDDWNENKLTILNQMDDRAWAFSFMDNGSYSNSDARLHLNRFTLADAQTICDSFNERYETSAKIKDSKGCTMYISASDYRKFCEKTAKYFHPSLRYKLSCNTEDEFVSGVADFKSYSLEIVTSITRKPVKAKSPMKYNIQVDDNHNYLVGSAKFLVSNCHKTKADTYAFTISSFNSKYRHGVSGTTELKKNMHLLSHHVLGPVVVEGHGDQLPFSVTTYNTNIPVPIRPGKMFFTMALTYLANHEERNKFVLSIIEMWLKAGHTVIATSDRTAQCDWFAAQVRNLGYTSESYHAKKFKNHDQRELLLQRVRDGKTQAMFAMRSMVLGLDIPRATAFFNILPTAHPENYYQEFCRVRTPYKQIDENGVVVAEKLHSWVIDFRDNNFILKACYKTRRRKYFEESAADVQDDLSDEQQQGII